MPLITTALVCTLLSGALGAGTFTVLQQRVPELFELFAGADGDIGHDLELGEDGDGYDEGYDGDAAPAPAMAAAQASADTKKFGEHIIVDKIKIKIDLAQ